MLKILIVVSIVQLFFIDPNKAKVTLCSSVFDSSYIRKILKEMNGFSEWITLRNITCFWKKNNGNPPINECYKEVQFDYDKEIKYLKSKMTNIAIFLQNGVKKQSEQDAGKIKKNVENVFTALESYQRNFSSLIETKNFDEIETLMKETMLDIDSNLIELFMHLLEIYDSKFDSFKATEFGNFVNEDFNGTKKECEKFVEKIKTCMGVKDY